MRPPRGILLPPPVVSNAEARSPTSQAWVPILFALLLAPSPARPFSRLEVRLGLLGEYLASQQESAGLSIDDDSLRTGAQLDVTGVLIDPRFLAFDLGIDAERIRRGGTAGEANSTDRRGYRAGVRLFSNRALSLWGRAARSRLDLATQAPSTTDTGEEARNVVGAQIRLPGRRLTIRAEHTSSEFSPDDAESLRGAARTRDHLTAHSTGKLYGAQLIARRDSNEFSSGRIRQDREQVDANLSLNQSGRHAFSMRATISATETFLSGGEPLPKGDLWIVQNRYRDSLPGGGVVRLDLSAEGSTQGISERGSQSFAINWNQPLRSSLQIELGATSLQVDPADQEGRTQNAFTSALRWTRRVGAWRLNLSPRLTYRNGSLNSYDDDQELGLNVFAELVRSLPSSEIALLVDHQDRQASVNSTRDTLRDQPTTALSGLQKGYTRVRARLKKSIGSRWNLELAVETSESKRVDLSDKDVTTSSDSARLTAKYRRLRLSANTTTTEVIDSTLPIHSRYDEIRFEWPLRNWLALEVVKARDSQSTLGIKQDSEVLDAGIRIAYAQLSFYLRTQQLKVSSGLGRDRTDQRIWVGVRRDFDFALLFSGAENGG